MVLLDFGTELRRGELSGVKWEDINFERKELTPRRSIVKQRVGQVKTEASKKMIPLDDDLIAELLAWSAETPYAGNGDYVFASTKMKGRQPYWMSRIMQHHIKPVATAAGIEIKGWHTLRHSYTTLLRQNGNDPKVVQGLLRHSSIKITMDIYDEAVSDEKQRAHRGVIRQVTRRDRSVIRSAAISTIPQVPEKLGVPLGTILNQIARARSALLTPGPQGPRCDVDSRLEAKRPRSSLSRVADSARSNLQPSEITRSFARAKHDSQYSPHSKALNRIIEGIGEVPTGPQTPALWGSLRANSPQKPCLHSHSIVPCSCGKLVAKAAPQRHG
jgi:hypothetical protein